MVLSLYGFPASRYCRLTDTWRSHYPCYSLWVKLWLAEQWDRPSQTLVQVAAKVMVTIQLKKTAKVLDRVFA
jgi:hypothetical protein